MDPRREYMALRRRYGPQHWWPVDGPKGYEAAALEICVGAILTQNTSWQNVKKALDNLRSAKAFSYKMLLTMPRKRLAQLIRPSGYYNQKALKLQAFLTFVAAEYGGSFRKMFKQPAMALREQLLAVHGIGKETADSMLLYAGNKPIFVVDAYTKRFLAEKGITFGDYDEYRVFFEKRLRRNVKLYQEFHALIVAWGKEGSRKQNVAR
ncbi:MAG: endonuclease III domain-containing protein [Candidatus Kerfeldbacteria bacterium]